MVEKVRGKGNYAISANAKLGDGPVVVGVAGVGGKVDFALTFWELKSRIEVYNTYRM